MSVWCDSKGLVARVESSETGRTARYRQFEEWPSTRQVNGDPTFGDREERARHRAQDSSQAEPATKLRNALPGVEVQLTAAPELHTRQPVRVVRFDTTSPPPPCAGPLSSGVPVRMRRGHGKSPGDRQC